MKYDYAISIILSNASRLSNVIDIIYAIRHSMYQVDVIVYGEEKILQFLKGNPSYVFDTVHLSSTKKEYSMFNKVVEVDDSWKYDDNHIKNAFNISPGFMRVVDVCLISDKNYIKYLSNVVRRINDTKTAGTKYNIYILWSGSVTDDVVKVKKHNQCSEMDVNIIPVFNLFYGIRENNISSHISNPTNIRLMICDLIPLCVSKLLYLDCDIWINSSIDVIYYYPNNGCMFSGVVDFGVSYQGVESRWKEKYENQYIQRFKQDKYINAGVLLLDIERMRMEKFNIECYDIYRIHSEFRFNDQDILNYYGIKHDCINIMPRLFNWQIDNGVTMFDKTKTSLIPKDAVIVHHVNKNKKLLEDQIIHDLK